MKTVFITGGIGSGKSEVCRYLAWQGIPVYDSDRETKSLYDRDPDLTGRLSAALGIPLRDGDGRLDRGRLAALVFRNPAALETLEGIVHPAVRDDFIAWRERQDGSVPFVVMESAIAAEKPLFRDLADKVVRVEAPEAVRLSRAAARDGVSPEAIRARMKNQPTDNQLLPIDYILRNDGTLDELHAAADRLLAALSEDFRA